MQIEVQVCDSTDPNANRVVDGIFRATPGALQALRGHKRVRIHNVAPPALTLGEDEWKVLEERIVPNV